MKNQRELASYFRRKAAECELRLQQDPNSRSAKFFHEAYAGYAADAERRAAKEVDGEQAPKGEQP